MENVNPFRIWVGAHRAWFVVHHWAVHAYTMDHWFFLSVVPLKTRRPEEILKWLKLLLLGVRVSVCVESWFNRFDNLFYFILMIPNGKDTHIHIIK